MTNTLPDLYITCETFGCENEGKVLNILRDVPDGPDDPDFCEAFGQGAEDDADFCRLCKELGFLHDPGTNLGKAPRALRSFPLAEGSFPCERVQTRKSLFERIYFVTALVSVTADDLTHRVQDAHDCPVASALRRVFVPGTVTVGPDHAYIKLHEIDLPAQAQALQWALFDKETVEPFVFEMRLPRHLCRPRFWGRF